MKKYKGLIFITLFLILGIITYGNVFKSQIKTVDIMILTPCKAESFVICTGKIEYANKQDVFLENACIVDDICVKVGDRVCKGDQLLKISQLNKNISSNLDDYYANENLQQVYSSIVAQSNFDSNNMHSEQLKKNIIFSPTSGIISNIKVENNLPIDNKTPVITISNDEKLSVLLNVNESKVSDVKVGQEVIISGAGFKGKEYIGIVRSISDEAKTALTPTGQETTVEVIVDIDKIEKDITIKPGFTAKCKIVTDKSKNAIIIPYESVKADENGKEYVFTLHNGSAKKIYIKTGREFDHGFEIIDGLSSNDLIIVNPDMLKNNDKVRVDKNVY